MKTRGFLTRTIPAVLILATGILSAGQTVVCRVSGISGRAEFQTDGSSGWKKIIPGMAFSEKDRIRTGDESWATLIFKNGTILKVTARSEVELARFSYRKGLLAEIRIPESGKIIALVRKVSKEQNRVRFVLPTAVVGVRGTDLSIDVADRDNATVALFKGKIVVEDFTTESGLSSSDSGMLLDFLREITLTDGQVTDYRRGKGLSRPRGLDDSFRQDQETVRELRTEAETAAAGEDRDGEALKLREEALAEE